MRVFQFTFLQKEVRTITADSIEEAHKIVQQFRAGDTSIVPLRLIEMDFTTFQPTQATE